MKTGKELFYDVINHLTYENEVLSYNGNSIIDMHFETHDEWMELVDEFIEEIIIPLAKQTKEEKPDAEPWEVVATMLRFCLSMGFLMGYQFKTEVDNDRDASGVE
jgi:hypothetical protein